MHELCGWFNILDEYERIHMSDVCDVRGWYTNQYRVYRKFEPNMYIMCCWILLDECELKLVYTMWHRINKFIHGFNFLYVYRNFTKWILSMVCRNKQLYKGV